LKLLLEKKVDVNAKDKLGLSPLFVAVKRGNLAILRYLINEGVNVNDKGNDGSTLLITASRYGHFAIMKYLIEEKKSTPRNKITTEILH
jgi:ankyrin repeat protein